MLAIHADADCVCGCGRLSVSVSVSVAVSVSVLCVSLSRAAASGPPGSMMKLRAQHSDSSLPYEVVLERSGGTGSDAGSLASGTTPSKSGGGAATPGKSGGKEPSAFERGKAACDAANALLDEVNRLRRSLATASEVLEKPQFTCFTGTQVQILTQKALQGAEQAQRRCCVATADIDTTDAKASTADNDARTRL